MYQITIYSLNVGIFSSFNSRYSTQHRDAWQRLAASCKPGAPASKCSAMHRPAGLASGNWSRFEYASPYPRLDRLKGGSKARESAEHRRVVDAAARIHRSSEAATRSSEDLQNPKPQHLLLRSFGNLQGFNPNTFAVPA